MPLLFHSVLKEQVVIFGFIIFYNKIGKTMTLGTYESFDKGNNLLKEALNYFYTNAADHSSSAEPMYYILSLFLLSIIFSVQ